MTKIIDRIKVDVIFAGIGAVLISTALGYLKVSIAIPIGGLVGYFGYVSIVGMVDAMVLKRKRKAIWAKVFLRYGLIIILVYVIIHFSYFSVAGLFIGLLLPMISFLGEGLFYIIKHMAGTE